MTDGRTWVVVGASGMLGREVQAAIRGRPVLALDRSDLDISQSEEVFTALAGLSSSDVVVNCAAYTAVDEAEANESAAFAVNAIGAHNLARACAERAARLVHVSTDYVFAGNATEPYTTDAPTDPRTAYGRSKLAGEWGVRAALPDRHWILRTAWLYGEHGPSFVRTMAKLEAGREFVDVVADQHGQPTWTGDLAHRIVETVEADAPAGIYHASASGRTTWHGLAAAVFGLLGADPSRVRAVTSGSLQRPAPRPAFSVLEHSAWRQAGLAPLRSWDVALAEAVRYGSVTGPRT